MSIGPPLPVEVPTAIVEAIRSFPLEREVEHCGHRLVVSPLDIYTTCPHCGSRLKLRSFASVTEIEDVFDAVFEWLMQPEAKALMERRQREIQADQED